MNERAVVHLSRGNGVSVNFVNLDRSAIRMDDGRWVYRISAAAIDHITLTSDPAYAGTAVWLAEVPLNDAPPRIRKASARWEIGCAAWLRARSADAPRACSERDASAMLASRRAEFAQMRRAVMSAVWRDRHHGGAIIGHAAFSRRGGVQATLKNPDH